MVERRINVGRIELKRVPQRGLERDITETMREGRTEGPTEYSLIRGISWTKVLDQEPRDYRERQEDRGNAY